MYWRVVNTDNFGSDYPDEKWASEPIETKFQAQQIAEELNKPLGPYSHRYYKVVKLPYDLQPGFEP